MLVRERVLAFPPLVCARPILQHTFRTLLLSHFATHSQTATDEDWERHHRGGGHPGDGHRRVSVENHGGV